MVLALAISGSWLALNITLGAKTQTVSGGARFLLGMVVADLMHWGLFSPSHASFYTVMLLAWLRALDALPRSLILKFA